MNKIILLTQSYIKFYLKFFEWMETMYMHIKYIHTQSSKPLSASSLQTIETKHINAYV